MAEKLKKESKESKLSYCSLPHVPERKFKSDVSPNRVRLIRVGDKKWTNGTELCYYFFDKDTDGETVYFSDGSSEFRTWTTKNEEIDIVRKAFKIWKDIGIGLKFKEVNLRDDADIRIGFMRGDGAWSYIGRDIRTVGKDSRTMNFGWDLTLYEDEIDTAVHEIGHTLGFPHEHQNPNSGIVWDEEAVYAELAKPPNNWDRETTRHNIIRKINPDTVQGSNWDYNSIMHYSFKAGLIKEPEQFSNGLEPDKGLSDRDSTWVKTFYPPLTDKDYKELTPFRSYGFSIKEGGQVNFIIQNVVTRFYDISTFGESDTVMVLFEDDENGSLIYCSGDDDSGEDYNSRIRFKLYKNRKYILRIRLYYSYRSGETAVMIW